MLPSSSPPSRAAPSTSDQVPVYPIQQSEASPTLYPASNFSEERSLGPHLSPRRRVSYSESWSPPSTPGDPSTPPPLSARSPQPWSPAGPVIHEANPTTPEHTPYYSQPPQPQEHTAGASPNMNHHQRELYYSHSHSHPYPRAGASGWAPRTPTSPTSPDITHRRMSSAQPLGSMTQNQAQQQQQPYTSPYMDGHRRGDYDGSSARGS